MKYSFALICSFLCLPVVLGADDSVVTQRPDGVRVVREVEVPPEFRNPWTPGLEEAYRLRVDRMLKEFTDIRHSVNTYFENEKRTYGDLMLNYLATEQQGALDALQRPDHQREIWHRETAGIDWYASFTIKHQIRKYFYFGHLLDPEYREQMRKGAKAWTEIDPLDRPHYAYKPGTTGWGPDAKNSWVDVRTTDNLWWMRVSSVYLMAEETGNTETAEIYKDRIRGFVKAQYRGGVGEWDSQNYLGHATAPVHNLYDFAKDPEVKRLAKASLDHYYTSAALKFWRGGWNGPMKRDYNAVKPMTMAAGFFSLLLGMPEEVELPREYDWIHVATSAYRPPMAVMALAARRGIPGTELFLAHPPYESAMEGRTDVKPQYFETQYYGATYQFGTLAQGTQEPDVNGFKLLVADPETGAEMIQLVPGPNPQRPGSPQYGEGNLIGNGRVAQFENLAIYLVDEGDAPWTWVLPNTTQRVEREGVVFARHGETFIAWHPIQISIPKFDEERSDALRFSKKRTKLRKNMLEDPAAFGFLPETLEEDGRGRPTAIQVTPRHPDYQSWGAEGKGGPYCGVALEIGEPTTHGSFEAFQQAVLDSSTVDTSALEDGLVRYTGSRGKSVELRAREPLSGNAVLRNGEPRSFGTPLFAMRNADSELKAPVHQPWGGGTLHVEAGGFVFTCEVDDQGQVSWENRRVE